MKLVIDCDPGIDDAMAITLMLFNKKVELLGITTVSGNRGVEDTSINTLKTLEYFGRTEIPVFKGAAKPIKKELYVPPPTSIHGDDGLGDSGLPRPKLSAKGDAVRFLKDSTETCPGEITILAIGPLTNIANLLEQVDARKIKEIYIMGGAFEAAGNATEFAEYNAYIDPDAAAKVLSSQTPIKVVGLDVTDQIFMTREEFGNFKKIDTPQARFFTTIHDDPIRRKNKDKYAILWDETAAMWLAEDNLIQGKKGKVEVVTDGRRRGQTIFKEGKGNVIVGQTIDTKAFWQYFDDFLRS